MHKRVFGRTKNEYQRKVWEYKRRIEIMKYTVSDSVFHRRAKKMRAKIRIWQGQILRIERRKWFIKELYYCVTEYFLQDAKKTKGNEKKPNVARNVFYRYGLDHGISGTLLNAFIGAKDQHTPMKNRNKIMKNGDNRIVYKNFVDFVKSINNGNELVVPKKRGYVQVSREHKKVS